MEAANDELKATLEKERDRNAQLQQIIATHANSCPNFELEDSTGTQRKSSPWRVYFIFKLIWTLP